MCIYLCIISAMQNNVGFCAAHYISCVKCKIQNTHEKILYDFIIYFIRIRRNCFLPLTAPPKKKPNLLCPEQTSKFGYTILAISGVVWSLQRCIHNIIILYDVRIDQLGTDSWKQIIFSIENSLGKIF